MSVRQGNNIIAGNGADEVVAFQMPNAGNNYTWYRKYKSGWVEQGGYIAATSSSSVAQPVALPIEMSSANYDVQKTYYKGADSSSLNWKWVSTSQSGTADTTTTVYISMPTHSYVIGCHWEVRGIAA